METLRALPALPTTNTVQERRGGGQRQADAFRRALQQGAADAGQSQQQATASGEPAVGRPLQPKRPADRSEQGTARHVDVLA